MLPLVPGIPWESDLIHNKNNTMKLPHHLLSAMVLLGGTFLASAQTNILLITNSGAGGSLETFLSNEGHVVSREQRTDGPGDDDNAGDTLGHADEFDFIIFERNTNSSDYRGNDGVEQAAWNAVTTPTLSFSTFLMRASRFGWVTSESLGTNTATASFDSPFPDPAHPFLAGLTGTPEQAYTAAVSLRRFSSAQTVDSGVTVVTEAGGAGDASIWTINPGTSLSDILGTSAGGLRIAWGVEDSDSGWGSAGSNAEQILRNIIAAVTAPVADSDGDGMDDLYEDINGLDKTDDGTLFPLLGPAGDKDGDGLTNLQEHDGLDAFDVDHGFGQTRADNEDTDGDLVLDNAEITGADNAFQTNTPGVAATIIPGLATDPNTADSDGDGLDDGQETTGSENVANSSEPTNPNTNDTDGDLMLDGYEITNNLLGGLDPNTDDAAGNLDGDTTPLTNLDEHDGTTLGVQTRADKADTDDDGYDDAVEDNIGSWDSESFTGTNPVNPDTDGDGLLDGDENPDLVGGYPGSGVVPTTSNPTMLDTDGDGVRDGYEVDNHGTNPTLADSDGDGASDPGELFIYGTDPLLVGDAPSAAQLAELRVNFQPTGVTGPLEFVNYEADHEVLATFDDQVYTAFGESITVGVSWDDGGGAGVETSAPQMFNRGALAGANGTEWAPLHRSWAGTDERIPPAAPMTITISGLPAGNYLWTSHHSDQNDQQSSFDASVTSASGTSAVTNVDPDSGFGGANLVSEIALYEQVFSSNGVDDVTVQFDSTGGWFMINAFLVTNTNLPSSGDLEITDISFEAGTGDLLITFSPSGTNRILSSSDDLLSAFTEEVTATLENSDSTFRVPAGSLNPGRDFFQVEESE